MTSDNVLWCILAKFVLALSALLCWTSTSRSGQAALSKMPKNLDSFLFSNTTARESSFNPTALLALQSNSLESVGVIYVQPTAPTLHSKQEKFGQVEIDLAHLTDGFNVLNPIQSSLMAVYTARYLQSSTLSTLTPRISVVTCALGLLKSTSLFVFVALNGRRFHSHHVKKFFKGYSASLSLLILLVLIESLENFPNTDKKKAVFLYRYGKCEKRAMTERCLSTFTCSCKIIEQQILSFILSCGLAGSVLMFRHWP